MVLAAALSLLPSDIASSLRDRFVAAPTALKACLFVTAMQAVVQVGSTHVQPFIYFQF
jgi:hypothetical protein